jgi:hypothetical protein
VRSGRDKPRRIALCAITHSSTNTLPFPPSILECEMILQLDIFSKTSTWDGTGCLNPLTTDTGRRSIRVPSMPIFGTYPRYSSTQTSIPTTTATRHMYPGRATTLTRTPVITSLMILTSPLEVLLREVADPDLRVGLLDREIRGSVIGSNRSP